MKRILTLLMTVSLLLCLAACGQPADHAPEQSPQQAEPSEPPAQTEPPALEGEALSVLPAEDAGLAEGGYDAYREADPMAEIVLLPTHYIKTSTGFGGGGATREDVALFAKHVGPNVKIKAAGGIANLQDAEDFINLGASRLGTSRIVKAVKAMEK